MRRLCLAFTILLLVSGSVFAQEPASKPESGAEETGLLSETGEETGLADVTPGETVEHTPETEDEANTGPVPVPQASEKAMRYYNSGNVLWWVNLLWSLAVPAVILATGFSARMRTWGVAIGRNWFFSFAAFIVIFSIVTFIIDLPLSFYQGFVRQHAYDLSNQTLGKWFGDSLKGLGVGIVIASLFGWVPYLLIKKSPRRWWLWSGILIVPFIFFINMIGPIWIAPLFNDFGPMHDKELEAQILSLAERSSIEGGRVFEVNKSVDTEAVNAYVTGFMNTKRIVLWDTILAKLESEEILFVMAHEMGHYVLGHVVKMTFLISLLILAGLYLVYRVSGTLIDRYGDRFGFEELGDFASLPLIVMLMSIFFFVLTPVMLTYTRHIEHEADRFGLELTHDNHNAATAFVKLQQENLGNPRPGMLYKLWRSSHPTLGDRIDFCNDYKPWESGNTMRYSGLFRE
jgi:Zn-dependent protease with chaperone function